MCCVGMARVAVMPGVVVNVVTLDVLGAGGLNSLVPRLLAEARTRRLRGIESPKDRCV